MSHNGDPWPPPIGSPTHSPACSRAGRRKGSALAIAIVLAFGVVGLVWKTGGGSNDSEFAQRRDRADVLISAAASIEKSSVGTSPLGWAREEQEVDRASASMTIDRWQGSGDLDPTAERISTYLFEDQLVFTQLPRFDDPSTSEATWYLMEAHSGQDSLDAGVQMSNPWAVFDEHADGVPRRSGLENHDGEELERFDLFVPTSAYGDATRFTIGKVGVIDASNGVTYSFWFGPTGALRRMLIEAETDEGRWAVDSWRLLSNEPIELGLSDPKNVRSWNELRANDFDPTGQ